MSIQLRHTHFIDRSETLGFRFQRQSHDK